MKWAMVGDLQIPYQDNRAVALFMQVMKAWKPDAIDFVGDIDDQLEYSTFSDGTTDEFFSRLSKNQKEDEKARLKALRADPENPLHFVPNESDPMPLIKANADGAKEFYTAVRQQHKKANIHSSLGNHDIRIFKYIDKKAPDYNDRITPNTLWGLDDLGITWREYALPPIERFAGIYVHHGATTLTTGMAVRSDIETYNISLIRGHDHRGGVVYKTFPIPGTELVGMGTGHMCDPSGYGLKYTINPSWELGFGIGHVHDNNAHLQFIHITKDYTCVVDGKLFKG